MADAYPTIPFDISSRLNNRLDFIVTRFNNGAASIAPNGLNNKRRTYNIVHKELDSTVADTLETFLNAHEAGEEVDIPLWTIDGTGATTSVFWIVSYNRDNKSGGLLANFNVIAEEF